MMFAQSNKVVNNHPAPGKFFTMPANQMVDVDYMAKTIIFAVKDQYRANCSVNSIENLMGFDAFKLNVGATSVEKIFPRHTAPEKKFNSLGQKYADLSLIYVLKYAGDISVEKAVNHLYESGYVEYAEPWFIPKVDLNVNDPLAINQNNSSGQFHLYTIKAAGNGTTGWNVETGNANVVTGIVDTGTEPTHPDLTNNIKYNLGDGPTVNGVDNDADGFIDNYKGWDVAMNDNDPTWQGDAHGVHVSGCAAASTNNSIGVAGTGYNCKFLPVKIANASGTLTAAYQGITYAADHGCNIINCSWGGGGAGAFEQTVIDYATINKNCLVVCAAGNNNLDQAFYPAALNYVLSVAATTSTDVKANFSNYNYSVDVSAPGVNINATYSGSSYALLSGTSMASPVTAGMCAIVKAHFPSYTGLQVGEQVKATTYNNYPVNPAFLANKLGTGRIDMYNALTTLTAKSVVFTNQVITDNNDGVYLIGDTLRISGTFVNYLNPTSAACAATLIATGPNAGFITMQNGSFTIGALTTLGTISNSATPFKAKIVGAPPVNTVIDFKLTITDGTYTANYFFSVTVNVDYINITVNDIYTTITSKGRIGWNADGQIGGLGFVYMADSTMMYESSMMIGTSGTQVSDMFRGAGTAGDVDNSSIQNVYRVVSAPISDFDVTGQFRDNVAPSPIGVTTHHSAYAWISAGNRKFVIVKYVVKNTTGSPISGLRVGVISDWDITSATYAKNKVNQDVARRMGYAYCTNVNGQYAGIKVLTQGGFNNYGIDNLAGGGGGIDPTAGAPEFDTGEKYTVMSTSRPTAGNTAPQGNDVMDAVSTGPYTIPAGDSIIVAFALIAGDNLAQLQTSADAAQVKWDGLTGIYTSEVFNQFGMTNYPNPTAGTSTIEFYLEGSSNVELKMFDVMGQEVITIAKGQLDAGKHEYTNDLSKVSNGIYFYKLTVDGNTYTQKVVVNK